MPTAHICEVYLTAEHRNELAGLLDIETAIVTEGLLAGSTEEGLGEWQAWLDRMARSVSGNSWSIRTCAEKHRGKY